MAALRSRSALRIATVVGDALSLATLFRRLVVQLVAARPLAVLVGSDEMTGAGRHEVRRIDGGSSNGSGDRRGRVDKVPTTFELVLQANTPGTSTRNGSHITIDAENDKYAIIALREIAEKTIDPALQAEAP